MLVAENYQNRPMFHGNIQKIKIDPFSKHGVVVPSSVATPHAHAHGEIAIIQAELVQIA